MNRWVGVLALGVALAVAGASAAQPAPHKPGTEHEKLKQMEGAWDVTMTSGPSESKGTFTCKMDLGGLWLVGDYRGKFGDMEFTGKLFNSYDPVRKKYTSVWIDSYAGSPFTCEGEYDKDGKLLVLVGEGYGLDGKLQKFKKTYEWKDKDTFEFKMYDIKDGKDTLHFTLVYRRKK